MLALKSYYEILLEYNLIIEYHTGIINLRSYINFKKTIFKDPLFQKNLNHVIHFKNVKFIATQQDIKGFVDFMKTNSEVVGSKRKIALITDTPNQVVTTTLYKILITKLNNSIEIFSTSNKALNWLNVPSKAIDTIINILIKFSKK